MAKKRVFIDGAFDLLSIAHIRVLERLKSDPNNFVIVGVHSEKDLLDNGIRVVMTDFERSENLKHTRFLDELIFPSPYKVSEEFVKQHSIDTVCSERWHERFSEVSSIFTTIPHEEGTTTNEMIERVLNQYDDYSERTLGRGFPYQELGINELEARCLFLRLAAKRKLQKIA